MARVFAIGPGDLGSIPGRVIPKTQKIVFDASLLNTQHYEVRIKSKVEQSRERSCTLPYPYSKGSLRVTLDYCRQRYFLYYFERNHSVGLENARTHNNTHIYVYIGGRVDIIMFLKEKI